MAIRTVVTMGYGNGTFNGTIPLVVTMGYISGEAPEQTGSPIKMCEGLHQRVEVYPESHQRIEMAIQKGQRVGGRFELLRL